ncbi:MAG: ADP-L-glycero-D-manno-heptose-6-epimerase [Chlamydiia bacterium]|nr:ADP-L-glycero-D-manno-heptose-6-epimerase [Chlamydiia bacterium]
MKKISTDRIIVVTGGAGFIGANLVDELNQRGYENIVIADVLADSPRGQWKNLRGKKLKQYVHEEDLMDYLMRHVQDVGMIFHLGACSDTMEEDCNYLMDNNYTYSVRLAEYALKHEIPMCYASSAATYGNGERGYGDDIDQIDQLRPINCYGLSKQLFDQWVVSEEALDQLLGFKFFNICGPYESHKGTMASVVLHFTRQVMSDGVIRLFKSYREGIGDGEQARDFTCVKDTVRIMADAALCGVTSIHNLGSGKATTYVELARAVFAALDKKENIEFIEMPEKLRGQYQYFTEAKMDNLKRAFEKKGLEPFSFTPLNEWVKRYVEEIVAEEGL